jgi:hypothetical protein
MHLRIAEQLKIYPSWVEGQKDLVVCGMFRLVKEIMRMKDCHNESNCLIVHALAYFETMTRSVFAVRPRNVRIGFWQLSYSEAE